MSDSQSKADREVGDREVSDEHNADSSEAESSSATMLKIATGIGLITGAAFFCFALYSLFATDRALPFTFAMLIGGAVNVLVCWGALNKSRVAWSFALALNGVGAVVFLFGAPKIRDGADLSIFITLLPCVAMSVSAVLLALAADNFE